MATYLPKNRGLSTLTLDANLITSIGAQKLAEALVPGRNQTLRVLRLGLNKIGDEGCTFLCRALINNMGIQELDIQVSRCIANARVVTSSPQGCSIGRLGTQAVADLLSRNSTLLILTMSSNQIGPQGASILADTLVVNRTLSGLSLIRFFL